MEDMLTILAIIAILLLFSSLVILHELGHFIAARRNGVEVDEFGIGFPPKIYGKKIGKTEYTINLLPLGGFVRMRGEDGEDATKGSFGGASLLAKTKILLAGVGMNLLTAYLVLLGLCLVGIPGLGTFEPSFLHPEYSQPKQLILTDVVAGSPAAKAGIVRDDYLVKGNGKALEDDDALRAFTQENAGKQVSLVVRHEGKERTVDVTLNAQKSDAGYLGVTGQQVYRLKYSLGEALIAAAWLTGALFVATIVGVFSLLMHIPTLLLNLFGSNVPSAATQASGPVGIIYILGSALALGWSYIFLIMANIAVALAAFNVLPLPALDGGRLAVLLTEKVTKKRFSPDTEAKYHTIGFLALIALMLLITVYDIRKFF
jgi:regulator of sigma E protease